MERLGEENGCESAGLSPDELISPANKICLRFTGRLGPVAYFWQQIRQRDALVDRC